MKNREGKEGIIDFNSCDADSFISDYVDSVSFTVLIENKANLIGTIDKIIVFDGKTFIGDYRHKTITAFSASGEPLFVIDKQGRGPGEYFHIQSFSVDSNHVYILDNYKEEIHLYSTVKGQYEKSLKLPYYSDDFESLENGGFILAYAPDGENDRRERGKRYRILVTDNKLRVTHCYLEYSESDKDAIGFHRYLNTSGNSVVYASFDSDSYYVFSRKDGIIKNTFSINNKSSLPLEQRSKIDFAISNTNFSYLNSVPFVCGDYVLFNYKDNSRIQEYLIISKENKIVKNSNDDYNNSIVGVIGSDDHFFICYWNKSIYNYMVENGFKRADNITEAYINDDATFLIKIYMK